MDWDMAMLLYGDVDMVVLRSSWLLIGNKTAGCRVRRTKVRLRQMIQNA